MDPVVLAVILGSVVLLVGAVLAAVARAYGAGRSAGAEVLTEREGRHVAELALRDRRLAEAEGQRDALHDKIELLRSQIRLRAQGGRDDAAALRRVDADDDPDGVLSAFPAGPAPGGDSHAPPAAPAAAGGDLDATQA